MAQDLKKKLKIYRLLGAEQFEKVVLKVEALKFKVIKKFFPNFLKHFDKYCDYKQKKALKKAKTQEQREEIIRSVKFSKMAMRKELNSEKNRNYHIDRDKPTEIIPYLEWNKMVHKRGIIKDLILTPPLIAATVMGFGIAIPFLVIEVISLLVNFECINIQNYNLCRAKRVAARLQRIEEKKVATNIEQYGEAAEVIHRSIEEKETLPTFDDIIANIDNPEQLRQMKALLQQKIAEREMDKKGRVKKQ